jgi:hypothetical protein
MFFGSSGADAFGEQYVDPGRIQFWRRHGLPDQQASGRARAVPGRPVQGAEYVADLSRDGAVYAVTGTNGRRVLPVLGTRNEADSSGVIRQTFAGWRLLLFGGSAGGEEHEQVGGDAAVVLRGEGARGAVGVGEGGEVDVEDRGHAGDP